MSALESELRQLGINLASQESDVFTLSSDQAAHAQTFLAFSAYGEFTPIKVGAGTKLPHADLERNKR